MARLFYFRRRVGETWRRREELFQSLERREQDLRNVNWLRFWICKCAGDSVLEEPRYGPERDIDDWADQRRAAQRFGSDARLNLSVEINGATVLQSHRWRTHFEVARVDHAVGNNVAGSGRRDATVTNARHHGVQRL